MQTLNPARLLSGGASTEDGREREALLAEMKRCDEVRAVVAVRAGRGAGGRPGEGQGNRSERRVRPQHMTCCDEMLSRVACGESAAYVCRLAAALLSLPSTGRVPCVLCCSTCGRGAHEDAV